MLLLEVSAAGVRVLCRGCGAEHVVATAEYRTRLEREFVCTVCTRRARLPERRMQTAVVRVDRRGWKTEIPRRSWL
jgi:hypothetical protein